MPAPLTPPHLNPALAATIAPPVMEARRWIAGLSLPADRPLINVSQAAPTAPPPEPLLQAMAEAVLTDPGAHLYGPDLGLPELRAALAERTARVCGGHVSAENVGITAGANLAFCATIGALAGPGDAVLLPVPWYFNHAMWLTQQGIEARPLPCTPDLLPDPEAARICPRTRAIVLVTPNNPAGLAYPPALIRAFADLARRHGLALVIDETYRDFRPDPAPPHDLFTDPDWGEDVVSLYSFSKAYRLTGHRVGAILTGAARMAQIEKVLDTVQICAPQLGQRAALWGLRHLEGWLEGERAETLARGAALAQGMARLPGWRLRAQGGYFAWVEHLFDLPAEAAAQRLVAQAGVLMLPGSMFRPDTDPQGAREMRIAVANLDRPGIAALIDRLATATI